MVLPKNLFEAVSFPDVLYHQNLIVISSDDLHNSNFIINYMLVSLLKDENYDRKNQIYGVLINQGHENYCNSQIKCGNNLRYMTSNKHFGYMDFNNDLEFFMIKIKDEETKKESFSFDFNLFKCDLMQKLDEFFLKDKEALRVLFIDDVTTFMALDTPLSDVILFINHLKIYCFQRRISLIIQSYRPDEKSSSLSRIEKLDINLRKNAKSVVICNKLDTGISAKVDGTILTKNYFNRTEQEFIFKNLERSVKVSNLGAFN